MKLAIQRWKRATTPVETQVCQSTMAYHEGDPQSLTHMVDSNSLEGI